MSYVESYRACCHVCHGEGVVQQAVMSMGGIGGTVIQESRCRACAGTGAGKMVTVVVDCDECFDAGCVIDGDDVVPCTACAS